MYFLNAVLLISFTSYVLILGKIPIFDRENIYVVDFPLIFWKLHVSFLSLCYVPVLPMYEGAKANVANGYYLSLLQLY